MHEKDISVHLWPCITRLSNDDSCAGRSSHVWLKVG